MNGQQYGERYGFGSKCRNGNRHCHGHGHGGGMHASAARQCSESGRGQGKGHGRGGKRFAAAASFRENDAAPVGALQR